jgi:hypothetical protein
MAGSPDPNGLPRGVVAVGASAGGVAAGGVADYLDVADEAEHALTILGKRRSESTSGTGERGER